MEYLTTNDLIEMERFTQIPDEVLDKYKDKKLLILQTDKGAFVFVGDIPESLKSFKRTIKEALASRQ